MTKRARTRAASSGNKPQAFQAFAGNKPRYSVRESAVLLGISVALIWKRIKNGDLASVRDGKRTFVTDLELIRYARASHE